MKECTFCMHEGKLRASKSDGLNEDTYVCDSCWRLLKNPTTALPLLRGHLVMRLRNVLPEERLKPAINKFMGIISEWKPRQ